MRLVPSSAATSAFLIGFIALGTGYSYVVFCNTKEESAVILIMGVLPAVAAIPNLLKKIIGDFQDFIILLVASLVVPIVAYLACDASSKSLMGEHVRLFWPATEMLLTGGGFHLYTAVFKRTPRDVVLNFNTGFGWDRAFVLTVWLVGFVLPMQFVLPQSAPIQS